MLNTNRRYFPGVHILIAITVAFVMFFVLGAGVVTAQGSLSDGRTLAVRYCLDCHAIDLNTPSLKKVAGAPSLQLIANDPKKSNSDHLTSMFKGSHSLMAIKAGGYLDDDQIHALIDYIQGLRK